MRKLIAIMIVAGLSGCAIAPELADLVKDMVVQTQYDIEGPTGEPNVFNTFSKYTFKLDTMGLISPFYPEDTLLLDSDNNTTNLLTASFVSDVTDEIEQNLQTLGFENVEETANPDFGVKVVILEQFSFFQTVSYPGYYSGYYGYYGGYYGPVVSTYTSNYVTMVIEVVDIKNFTANGSKYNVIWSAYIGDVGTTIDRDVKLVEAVNQAFVQSPYVSKD